MIFLNAGNLWDDGYLNTVIWWNEEFKDKGIRVASLFGSIAKLTPTARSADRLPYRDWNFIDRYVSRMKEANIEPRYTLNQSCIESIQGFRHNWDTKLKDDITELHNIGIEEWTVTSPLLVELLVDMFPEDFIEISTIAEVSTPEDAERWMRLGADGVNISTSINRDFEAIRGIIATGIKTSILANEACLYRCPWRRECYNLSSHDSLRSEELFGFYPFRRCNEVRLEHPEEWISSRMVLPQWMKTYQESLPNLMWFKVAFRTHPREIALPILRAYMEQKFDGNYCDLWPTISHLGSTPEPRETTYISTHRLDNLGMLNHFIVNGGLCKNKVCGVDCQYCKTIYKESIPTPKK